ncbi:hypothetical protein QBC37DRAFT_433295 [Rhypophila decipiens]|uniref:Uncharacterized protein n=1 Tax=Rhypophila decipiens TaxID=261697 RepID=A0AAN6XV83_9PEZI|nr:hypothetical protein QBC37DRAFT_433295 [Rhypophila decipiens]
MCFPNAVTHFPQQIPFFSVYSSHLFHFLYFCWRTISISLLIFGIVQMSLFGLILFRFILVGLGRNCQDGRLPV